MRPLLTISTTTVDDTSLVRSAHDSTSIRPLPPVRIKELGLWLLLRVVRRDNTTNFTPGIRVVEPRVVLALEVPVVVCLLVVILSQWFAVSVVF